MLQAVRYYAGIVAAGGWTTIPNGRTVHLGDSDRRLPAIRARLQATGDLPVAPTSRRPAIADPGLINAVREFQRRHGLVSDGLVGRQTLAAMNLPAAVRLTQLRINLKRLQRLVSAVRAYRYVMVNVPDFRLVAIQDQTVALRSRVIVGRTDRQTPELNSAIRAVTFHPIWTVPSSIIHRDLYPKFKSDPDFFARGDFLLSGITDGLLIDPSILPDILLTPDMVRIYQLPGPNNALGMIRLEMPNRHAIFLHDTSSHELYQQDQRSFSSGCIRVEQIVGLAQWLLVENIGWDRHRIDEALDERATLTVQLPEPIPVFLIYITAWVSDDSPMPQFRRDIYQLDLLPITTGP